MMIYIIKETHIFDIYNLIIVVKFDFWSALMNIQILGSQVLIIFFNLSLTSSLKYVICFKIIIIFKVEVIFSYSLCSKY